MEDNVPKSSDGVPDVVEAHSTTSVDHRARTLPDWLDNDAGETSPKKPKVEYTSVQETADTTGEPTSTESADVDSTSADVNGDDGVATNSGTLRNDRPKCKYGGSCYRYVYLWVMLTDHEICID